MTMNINEELIKYLLSLKMEYKNGETSVYTSELLYSETPIQNLNKVQFCNELRVLESEGFVKLKFGDNRTLANGVTITLFPKTIHYFDIKEQQRKFKNKEIRKEIRAWITLIIAIAGFVLSVISLYLDTLPPK